MVVAALGTAAQSHPLEHATIYTVICLVINEGVVAVVDHPADRWGLQELVHH